MSRSPLYLFLGSLVAFFLLAACGGASPAQLSGSATSIGGVNKQATVRIWDGDDEEDENSDDFMAQSDQVCTGGQMTPAQAAQIKQTPPVIYYQDGGTIKIGNGGAYVQIYGTGNTIEARVGGGSLVIEIFGGGNSIMGGGGGSIIHLYGSGNRVDLKGGGGNILNFHEGSNSLIFGGGGCNSAFFKKGSLSANNSAGGGGNSVNGQGAETKVY